MNCLICLEDKDDIKSMIDVLSDEGQTLDVQKIVEQHFWLRFAEFPLNSKKYVCRLCWSPILTFHQFYVRVEQAHNPLQEIALKFDCEVLIDTQPLPVLECNEPETEPENQNDSDLEFQSIPKSVQIKPEPLAFAETIEENYFGEEKYEGEEEINDKDVSDEDYEPPAPKKRRGRPKKNVQKQEKPIVFASRRPKRKSVKIRARELEAPVRSKKQKTLEIKKEKDVVRYEENSEADSDSDNVFNDGDFDADIGDCDSENESGDARKLQAKEKYRITRQSDAYIATHFKLSCCLCEEDLNDFNVLKMHFRSKHKVRGYVYCCQRKFVKRGLLVDHLRTHENPEYFKCPTCEKVMSDRRCLGLHLKLHEGNRERIFQCTICKKGFFKKAIYNRHMLLHIPEDQKKEICSTCNKAFPTKYILRQHIHLTHLNTYASICDVCGKAVRGGRELFQRHMTQHTGETLAPVQCQICGTTVTTKYGLSRHMRTMHNEEHRKPLECKICSKVSPSLQAHKSHLKYMHNTERKHQCPMCKKAFKRPTELKEHLSTHTGEVLYTCPHCPKTFKSNANMHSHRKKMHRAEWEERRQQRFKNSHPALNCDDEKDKSDQPEEISQINLDPSAFEEQNLSKADYFDGKHELFTSLDVNNSEIDPM